MEGEVRYCTAEDGVRIAYCVEGEGPPVVVCAEFAESFSLLHLFPAHEEFMRRLREGRTLIRYDSRGCGLSQRDVMDLSGEALVEDLKAVIAAVGVRRFDLYGAQDGGLLAIAYAARHTPRPDRIVVYGGFVRALDVFTREGLLGLARMARADWNTAVSMFGTGSLRGGYPEAALQLAELMRQSTSGEVMAKYIETNLDLDLTAELPNVKTRTLVIHRIEDPFAPISQAQKFAAEIPGARFVPLSGNVHLAALGDSQAILDVIDEFLKPRRQTGARGGRAKTAAMAVRTVLFTDLVGHTEMMSRLGDDRGRDVLREHERITRETLKSHGGTEVKTMGDGFMASFGSVTKAVECAIALQKAFAERQSDEPLNIRVGLNAGEPIEEDGDLFGSTVILASRIAAKAEGGEILVADTVRGLCSGKGFLFADRGEFVAKGFEEPVRISEVSWRNANAS